MPKYLVYVDVLGDGDVTIPTSNLQASVLFTNSSEAPVSVAFTVEPPFDDPTNPFWVPSHEVVQKTVPRGTPVGGRSFYSSAGRTGDIDIIAG